MDKLGVNSPGRKKKVFFSKCGGAKSLVRVQILSQKGNTTRSPDNGHVSLATISLQSADWTQEVVTCAVLEASVWYLRLCSLGGGDLSRRFGCGLASLRLETENREKGEKKKLQMCREKNVQETFKIIPRRNTCSLWQTRTTDTWTRAEK